MVRTLDEPGLSDADRAVIENVARHATHVVMVGSPDPTPTPDWAYTIGLHHTFGHPEVILFGLAPELAHTLLNDVRDLIVEGHHFADRTESDEVLTGRPVAFREVRPVWHEAYVGVMRWFYDGEPVPVLQMFWPDRESRFPWALDFDTRFAGKQPLLFEDDPVAAGNTEYLREIEPSRHWPPSPPT